MNVGVGNRLMTLLRAGGPTQSQINHQAASGGGTLAARDSLVRTGHAERARTLVGSKVSQLRVLDRVGATKVSAAKKR